MRKSPKATRVITVTKPGISSVQDLGRLGQLGRGLSWNGAADGFAARVANAFVGNEVGAHLIEIVAVPFERVTGRECEACGTGTHTGGAGGAGVW